ncbi:MAG: DUF934 domain-containing protein [Rhodoferax sp.]|jgi:uncharacterized protein (DUF934 family)|nr:DUF934 domain-containing protein [Rhodoferax sp.]HQZ08386.1 DUF934 domain-containing protein [Burkholderiaceae bacterium]
MRLLTPQSHLQDAASGSILQLNNDAELQGLALDGVTRIELQFPKFSDGRAFSQAVTLRRRLGFKADIRATGDVLVDQLVQMQRSGFDSAVLRDDQDFSVAERQLSRFAAFYQGDERESAPHFRRAA